MVKLENVKIENIKVGDLLLWKEGKHFWNDKKNNLFGLVLSKRRTFYKVHFFGKCKYSGFHSDWSDEFFTGYVFR